MSNGLQPPCFKLIADALLEQVRHEASCQAIVEPFFTHMPVAAPGMLNAHKLLQRRLVLMAEAQRLFEIMAPYEDAIRHLAQVAPGERKLDG
jgi:hypothetical protein